MTKSWGMMDSLNLEEVTSVALEVKPEGPASSGQKTSAANGGIAINFSPSIQVHGGDASTIRQRAYEGTVEGGNYLKDQLRQLFEEDRRLSYA